MERHGRAAHSPAGHAGPAAPHSTRTHAGTRSQGVILLVALLAASLMAALYLRGLRLVVRLVSGADTASTAASGCWPAARVWAASVLVIRPGWSGVAALPPLPTHA
jgi:hypothetical protein